MNSTITKRIFYFLILPYIFFFAGNNILGLTHPDEVFYVQTARQMIQQKSWLVPYLFDGPNFEKPIFSYWLLIAAFFLFGISSFSARFFPAVFGLLGMLGIFILGNMAFKKEEKGLYGALILMSSVLYIGLARTIFTDMFFTVFIELSLVSFYWAYTTIHRKGWGLIFFWLLSGLAVLTKGIPGMIPIVVVLIFLIIRKDLKFIQSWYFAAGFFVFCITVFPWYIYMMKTFGHSFIQEFFYNDHLRRILEAEHRGNDTWYFYPLSIIGLMAPWSIFVVLAMTQLYKKIRLKGQPIYLFLAVWIGVVFCTFQVAHSKLVSYVFPLFPALALIVGDFVSDTIHEPKNRKWFVISSLFLSMAMLTISVSGLTILSTYVPSKHMVFNVFLLSFLILIGTCFISLNIESNKKRLVLIAVQVPILLMFCLWNRSGFEDYVTSKNLSSYLLSNYVVSEPILCSKSYLRSVRFFTDKEVVMLNLNRGKFFSPHSVRELTSEKEVHDFINNRPSIFGVLNKHAVKDLRILVENSATVDILKIFGNQYLVELKPKI